MAGFLSLFEGTLVIDVMTGGIVPPERAERPEWWVEVRRSLSQGDYEAAQKFLVGDTGVERRAIEGQPEEVGEAVVRQKTDLIGYQRSLVSASLVEWNLTDDHGERLPIQNLEDRKRSLAKLPPSVFTSIYAIVSANNQPRTPAEEARFRGGAADSGARGASGTDGAGGAEEVLAGSVPVEAAGG